MAGNVKHKFESAKADGGDATLVRPSNWNDDHEGAQEIEDRDVVEIAVDNTAVETSIYSHQIDGGILGATGGVRLTLSGHYRNNDGADRLLTLRVKLGATTVLTSNAMLLPASANWRDWSWDISFLNLTDATQIWRTVFFMPFPGAENFVVAQSSVNESMMGVGREASSEDTSGNLILGVTVQHDVASANITLSKLHALLELIPAA